MGHTMKARVSAAAVLGMWVMSLGQVAQAQTLPGRPGLWIESTSGTMNGNALPGLEATLEAYGPEVHTRVRAALKRYGLPLDGAPSLKCLSSADFDVDAVLRKARQECPGAQVEKTATGVKYRGTCQGQSGTTASVEGEVRMSAKGDEIVSNNRVSGQFMKGRYVSEHRSIQKWIGGDCSHPPAGVDREWLTMDQ
ncbi:DUF3617 family protein [Aquabacterium sp. A3]|uniref:DUF3617 family protein n=1 Tax=Aquabacterium sp. A3 TaxID=3132829 RepID=UPI003119F5B5